jgi:lipopolysaccharide/colanic/teichoic acid biosynthesis glycosyltransferase
MPKSSSGTSAGNLNGTLVSRTYFARKVGLDWALAAILAIPALPAIAVLVLLVRLTSRGPGIFSQLRVGRHGRTYHMYKIRTMVQDAERRTGPIWATTNDPRVTWLGKYLRKLHLDELPQIWNVLKGDMSFVGPRPERPEFTHRLAAEIPGYAQRLVVLPGITGLAQVNLPPDTDLESVRRKLALDMEYVHRGGLWLDIRLMVCTGLRAIGIRGHWTGRFLGVHRKVDVTRWLSRARPEDVPHLIDVDGHSKVNGHSRGDLCQAAAPQRPR